MSRGRIVGGNNANPGAWPWQVYLDIRRGVEQVSILLSFCLSLYSKYKGYWVKRVFTFARFDKGTISSHGYTRCVEDNNWSIH